MSGAGIGCQFNAYGRCFGNGAGGIGINVFAEGGIYFDPFVFFAAGRQEKNCCYK
jgi:hypothetical protein